MLLLLFYLFSCDQGSIQYGWSGRTMGTTYQVKITQSKISESEINRLKIQVDSALVEVNRQMSTYDPDSEISRFNQYQDTLIFPVSEAFAAVVTKAVEISNLSEGAFDITVANLVNLWGFGKKGRRIEPPPDQDIMAELRHVGIMHVKSVDGKGLQKTDPKVQIDLSAIAKGFGVDVIASVIENKNLFNYMVEVGGEVIAKGVNSHGEAWKIGVDNPALASLPGQDIRSILAIQNVAVATSGDYRNYFEYMGRIYSHTIDPMTGKPVTHNLASVTVIADDCITADALATALMVMGKEKGMQFIERIANVEALMITRTAVNSYNSFQSSGFSKYIYQ